MSRYYDWHGNPIRADQWSMGDNMLARAELGDCVVSTVYLGLDHSSLGEGPPLIFETMTFGGSYDGDNQWRYSTQDEALAHHRQLVEAISRGAWELPDSA